jgi:hypothetical protein
MYKCAKRFGELWLVGSGYPRKSYKSEIEIRNTISICTLTLSFKFENLSEKWMSILIVIDKLFFPAALDNRVVRVSIIIIISVIEAVLDVKNEFLYLMKMSAANCIRCQMCPIGSVFVRMTRNLITVFDIFVQFSGVCLKPEPGLKLL